VEIHQQSAQSRTPWAEEDPASASVVQFAGQVLVWKCGGALLVEGGRSRKTRPGQIRERTERSKLPSTKALSSGEPTQFKTTQRRYAADLDTPILSGTHSTLTRDARITWGSNCATPVELSCTALEFLSDVFRHESRPCVSILPRHLHVANGVRRGKLEDE
jgi:hypothetical protein